MKILVVDDELVSRMKMQKIMSGVGDCVAVANGDQALTRFKKALEAERPFDLVTLDVLMPEMDGTEVLSKIRQIEEQKQIPKEQRVKILMVTSQSDKNTVIICIQAECDDYIVKPFDREMIMEKLEKFKDLLRE
jgi:two-component system chemotaxis response regulator CheY